MTSLVWHVPLHADTCSTVRVHCVFCTDLFLDEFLLGHDDLCFFLVFLHQQRFHFRLVLGYAFLNTQHVPCQRHNEFGLRDTNISINVTTDNTHRAAVDTTSVFTFIGRHAAVTE